MDKLDTRLAGSERGDVADDFALVQGTLDGKRDDYARLVERHQRPLYRFVLLHLGDSHAADEIVQMTFVQAYVNLSRFRAEASFKTWIHRIALNFCHDRARFERRRSELSAVDAIDRSASTQPSLEDLVLGATVERRITGLPRRQRAVLGLRIWSDLSFKEIGRLLGTSENSAKVNYHHAIRKLKQLLTEEDS